MKDAKSSQQTPEPPVPDNQNVITAGPRGPQLLQDVWYLEKNGPFRP